jgi:hypothetical protein
MRHRLEDKRAARKRYHVAPTGPGYFYQVPDALESFEQAQRYENADLQGMGPVELGNESRRLGLALAYTPCDHDDRPWLEERLVALSKLLSTCGEPASRVARDLPEPRGGGRPRRAPFVVKVQ